MDFLELFNVVAKKARPIQTEWHPIEDVNVPITEYGLDSLDIMMTSIYLCELYGIPEEIGKDMPTETVAQIEAYVFEHNTQEPDSLEAVERAIK